MATSLSLENDSSLAQGYIKVNGSTAATLTTSGITGNLTGNVTGNLTGSLTQGGSLTLATAQTASGTAVDFTGIPSWVKRITVMFSGISTSGSSNCLIQIGSGSIVNTGYSSQAWASSGTGVVTTGFVIFGVPGSVLQNGIVQLCLFNSNTWIESGIFGYNNSTSNGFQSAGTSPALSGSLDRVRITTSNGTDTFDAGTINISYEV
jgi:hypothetical protein